MAPPDINNSSVSWLAEGSQGDLTQGAIDATFDAGPSPAVIGLLIAAVILVSYYIAGDGTVVVPAVILIIFGGALVPLLPAQFVTLAWSVVVVGLAVAVYVAIKRFAVRGGF